MLDINVLTSPRSEFFLGFLPRLNFLMILTIGLISAPQAATAQSAGADGGHKPVEIRLFPANASLVSKGKQQFTAALTGTSDTRVAWSATAGSVDSTGF